MILQATNLVLFFRPFNNQRSMTFHYIQASNQSTSQTPKQPTSQATNQATTKVTNQSTSVALKQPTSQATDHPTIKHKPFNHPVVQTNKLVSQPTCNTGGKCLLDR